MIFFLAKCQLLKELNAVIAVHRLRPTGTFQNKKVKIKERRAGYRIYWSGILERCNVVSVG